MPTRGVNHVIDSGESAAQWEADWRKDVAAQLKAVGEANASTAVILERITGQLNDHDRRIGALEAQPAVTRSATFSTYQTLFMAGTLAISLIGLILSLSAHLSFH